MRHLIILRPFFSSFFFVLNGTYATITLMCIVLCFPQAGIENIRRAASLNDSPTFIHVSKAYMNSKGFWGQLYDAYSIIT